MTITKRLVLVVTLFMSALVAVGAYGLYSFMLTRSDLILSIRLSAT